MKMTNRKNLLKNKWIWAGAAFLFLVLISAYLIGPRMLYGNPMFQAWVQSQIADQTKGMFKFQTIKGGLFSADLKNLYLDLDSTAYNVQKVETPAMNASFALIPLMKNQLVIKSLTMEGGHLDIKLNGGTAAQASLPVSPYFRLKKGELHLSNLSGWTLDLADCNLKVEQSGAGEKLLIEGSLSAGKGRIGGLEMEDIEGRFRLQDGVLKVEKFQATLPGKSRLDLSGSYQLSGKRSIETTIDVKSSDIKTLLSALDFSNRFAGEADVTLQAEGVFTPGNKSLNGAGKANLKKIKPLVSLPKFPAFNDAPIFQRVRNLDDLKGKAAFQLDKGKIVINDLDIRNSEVQINGSATVGYNRSLSSDLTFTGNKTVDGEIPAMARDVFKHDAQGNVVVPFSLTGTTRDPQVDVGDVVGKVLGNPIKALNPLNFFK